MKQKLINENQSMRYRVVVNGKIITECSNIAVANTVIANLPQDQQESASILPVTVEGKQLLNESFA